MRLIFYFSEEAGNTSSGPPSSGWVAVDEERATSPPPSVTPEHDACEIPTVSVIKPVASAYESMVLSEEFSNVKLVCEDAVRIPAHKIVLASSSSYFKAVFSGHPGLKTKMVN